MTNDALFPPGGQNHLHDATTGKKSMPEPATDWERLRRLGDAELRAAIAADPAAPATDEAFWKNANVVFPRDRYGA